MASSKISLNLPLQISERRALLMVADIVLNSIATLGALWLWAQRAAKPLWGEFLYSQWHWFLVLPALWFILANIADFYDLRRAANLLRSGLTLIQINLLVWTIYFLIYFFSPPESLPRVVVLFQGTFTLLLVGIWRAIYATLLAARGFRRRVLVIGAGLAGQAIVRAIWKHESGYEVLGFIDDAPELRAQEVIGIPVLGTHADIARLVQEYDLTELILAITHDMHRDMFQVLMDCREHGVYITPMPVLYEQITGRVPVEHIGQNWYVALPMSQPSAFSPYQLLRRAVDIILALCGLILTAPLFPLVALAIVLDSPGHFLYEQERVGLGGKTFKLLKFRSMGQYAEKDGKARWATADDVRTTRIGKFIRRTRLDELPQLANILCGDMSLIGPRPERPQFIAELQQQIPFYRLRLAVRPGLTGWAQVKYHYGSSVEDALIKLQYDLYYIKHQSFYLDLLILLKTIGVVLAFKGT